MPVSSETSIVGPYYPNGATIDFAFDFKAASADEVVAVDGSGNLISPSLYSVALDADEGGTLSFGTAPEASDYPTIFVMSDPELTQPSDFDNSGPSFNPAALTRAIDRAAIRDLKIMRQVGRAFTVPFGEDGLQLPPVIDRANRYVSFLPDGTPLMSEGTGSDLGLRQDIASVSGGDMVRWIQTGVGAVARTILARFRDDIYVTDFLSPTLWGTAGYDAAPGIRACIAAHPGKRIFFPKPAEQYTLLSAIGELPEGTALVGAGHRKTKLVRGYSAADYLIVAGESTRLENIWIDGDGANFTGGGVQLKLGTGRQSCRNLRLINFAGGIPLHFQCTGASSAQASGSQSSWHNLEAWRVDSSAGLERYGVVHDDPGVNSAGHPIEFISFNSSGYESIDFGACNNWHVTNSNLFSFKTSDRGVGVDINGCRISEGTGGAVSITLTGGGSMTGVHCYPNLIFSSQSGNAWSFVGGYMNSGYTDNNPNSTTVVFDRTLRSYTPVWKGGATDVTVGNGSSVGFWQRNGTSIVGHARLVIGSTTVLPAGGMTVSLPDKCHGGIPAQCLVSGHITRGSTVYKFGGRIIAGELVARMERDTTGSVTSTSPGTLASGDVIFVSFQYLR